MVIGEGGVVLSGAVEETGEGTRVFWAGTNQVSGLYKCL